VSSKAISVTRLAVAALLMGILVIGCGRHDGGPATATPAVQQSQVPGTSPTPGSVPSDAPSGSPDANATDPGATAAPGSTIDPIDTELSQIENQLNGVNGSLSGSDAGPSAGE